MNNLREKFKNAFPYSPSRHFEECEQITDDFSVKFAEWILDICLGENSCLYTEKSTTELQQYFKENVYGK